MKVLVFAGDADLCMNWVGTLAWTRGLKWRGHGQFKHAKAKQWLANEGRDEVVWGETWTAGGLTFTKVSNAGTMPIRDQPVATYDMLSRFVAGPATSRDGW